MYKVLLVDDVLTTGATVSEAAKVSVADVSSRERLEVSGHFGRKRSVTLTPACRASLEQYLALRGTQEGPLFIRYDRARAHTTPHPITPRSIQRSLERYRKAAGIAAKVTPGTLRHAYAMSLLEAGESLEHVKELLGHKHKSTTEVYKHIDRKRQAR